MKPLLCLSRVSKTFGKQRVLDGVALQIHPGSVHAIVGHNGSGKSTLIKILAGVHNADPGAMAEMAGVQFNLGSAKAAGDAGLRFVHQDLGLVEGFDSVDNLLLGQVYPRHCCGSIDWTAARDQARDVLTSLGYHFDVTEPVSRLTQSQQTGLAIARAVNDPCAAMRVLVLDEPTAALPAREVTELFRVMRHLVSLGIGILFVSHHLEEVFAVSDTVTVLRDGHTITTDSTKCLSEAQLLDLMFGASVKSLPHKKQLYGTPSSPCLEVVGLRSRALKDVNLAVRPGEVVGVAGVSGSGCEDLLPAIFGGIHRTGQVQVNTVSVPVGRPDQSIKRGVGYLPSDRQRTSVLGNMTAEENLTIAKLVTSIGGLIIDRRAERSESTRWMQALKIRSAVSDGPLAQYSGGNQQKVVLGRWLRLRPNVLLIDEPTQGVDVRSTESIHSLIKEAAVGGMAFLICSSDTDELVQVCSRVITIFRGRIASELSGADISSHAIDAAILTGR